jgi:hypothetical protein
MSNVEFIAYSKVSLKGVDKELTKLIQVDAEKAGWPLNITKQLKVSIKDLKIVVYYPETYTQQIDDLEYGDGKESPKPVFRRFIAKNTNFLGKDLADSSLNYLTEQGLIP